MSTLILYATKHGTTKTCALELQNLLSDHTDVCPVEQKEIDLTGYNQIILGGSIYMGDINRKLKSFLKKHNDQLEAKIAGLFLCCMYKDEKAEEQFHRAFPENLRNKAIAHGIFGGAFNFEKMNFMEKKIIKKVADVEKSVSLLNKEALQDFANKLNS